MKKYTIGLVILIFVGAALSYFTLRQNNAFDEDVYLKTTASIRNLKIIDNTINILLFQMRYEDIKSYVALEELGYNLSDEFDNLRFEALLGEIESSPELENETIGFDRALAEKLENIEKFIELHKRLLNARKTFASYSQPDAPFLTTIKNLSLENTINEINLDFYKFVLNSNPENKNRINQNLGRIDKIIDNTNETDKDLIYGYIFTLSEIILTTEETHNFFVKAANQATAERLNTLELAYTNFHNRFIEKSEDIRNALIAFGIVLLALLLFFAYLLRKNYLSLEQQVQDRTEEIQLAYNDLQESQEQLIQSEKMASLGEMVAGVAHEINTPLGYVNSNIDTVQLNVNDMGDIFSKLEALHKEATSSQRDNKQLSRLLTSTLKTYKTIQSDELFDESQQLLDDSSHGLNEISKLVMSLKDFARLDRQSTDQIDIHSCIDSSLTIATNHIRENNVSINKEFATLPNIVCTPSKLNQLFLNIITNASQAMKDGGGELSIKTQLKDENIIIIFTDQGVGMDEETSQKMFDPFFTSKPIGEGTGLGMSIAYKIVDAHKGKIQVKSKLGVGTSIAIQLPIDPSDT